MAAVAFEVLHPLILDLCLSTSQSCWFAWDFPSASITCSKEYYELMGCDSSVRPSMESWLKAAHPDDRELFAATLRKAREGQEGACEIRVNTRFKGLRWFCFRCRPVENGCAGIFMDVSSWRAAEEIIRRDDKGLEKLVRKKSDEFRKELFLNEQEKRLAEGHSLADSMANELRNPLAALRLALFNLKKKLYTPFNFEQFEHIDLKLDESSRALENMIAYLNIGMPVFKRVDIAVIVIESIEESGKSFPRVPAKITSNLETLEGVAVDGDDVQLKQMFRHILDNSFDALSGRNGSIEISGALDERGVAIRITDNGCGIPHENIKKVFNPLFTTKTKGAGLGLSISRQIVSLHNGTIDIESRKDRGTSVIVFLPSSLPV